MQITKKRDLLINDLISAAEEKKEEKNGVLHYVFWICFPVFIFFFTYLMYNLYKTRAENENYEIFVRVTGISIIAFLLIVLLILLYFKKLDYKKAVFFIIFISYIGFLTYMLYTPMKERQHDTWSDNGHYDYAVYMFNNFSLPNKVFDEKEIFQFYHPPLNYFIQACFMHLFKYIGFYDNLVSSNEQLFGACQILSCYYSFLTVVFIYKSINLLKIKDSHKIPAIIFGAFFPRLFQFAGQLNNDPLSSLLTVISIYYLLRWYLKGKKILNIVLCATFLGLAMSTKLSSVIVCGGFAVVFIIEFVKTLARKDGSLKFSSLLIQYLSFLMIVAPLGLWFQFYSHYVYKIPFNFVFRNLNADLFTGPRSYIQNSSFFDLSYYDSSNSGKIYTDDMFNLLARFIFPFYVPDCQNNFIYANPFDHYNILTYAIKTAAFGEFSYINGDIPAVVIIFFGYIIYFLLLFIIFYSLFNRKLFKDKVYHLSLFTIFSIIAFYLYLQVKMPFGCSMDFRYIVPIILPLALVFACAKDKLENSSNLFSRSMSKILVSSLVTFSSFSLVFYLVSK